jgi:hypothetical protein
MTIAEWKKRAQESEIEYQVIRKQVDAMSKISSKSNETQQDSRYIYIYLDCHNQAHSIRQNKNQEQIRNLKEQIRQQETEHKAIQQRLQSELHQLEQQQSRAEQSRSEFIRAFRKQQELIDVLKRQVMHLEAAGRLKVLDQTFMGLLQSDHREE